MSVVIDCPGTHTLTSRRTRTSWGVSQASNSRTASARAQAAATADLRDQLNDASCDDGCVKVSGTTTVPSPPATCKRMWWTFWIVIRCKATAIGTLSVECRVIA